jgi:hypothetical protein
MLAWLIKKKIVVLSLVVLFTGCAASPLLISSREIHVAVPASKRWELRFPRQNWTLEKAKTNENQDSYYFMFVDREADLIVSFAIEPARKCLTSKDCRDFVWSDPGPGYQGAYGLDRFELNGFSVMKCIVPATIGAVQMKQLNYSAHMVREGYWIDMHISKVPAEPGDEEIFKTFVESINLYGRR